ncbi:MAG TPA: helix-turn-helix transcriptional regulator [Blastocatellia bacterium]|nr:helix-turn-helix transcriptional regulator [Blastocatellia bacterium]
MGDYSKEVKHLRQGRGWSQEQLAEIAGISVRTIQRMEAGESPSVESLKAIANAFEMDVQSLLQSKDPQPEPSIGAPGIVTQAMNHLDKTIAPLSVLDRDLADAQLEMKRLDVLSEDRPGSSKAGTKLQDIYMLQGLIKRFQSDGRPAMAWKLQRQVEGIKNDGRVATSSERTLDKILDIEAERNALREEANRSKRGG